ncbi:Rqc2 family fibronectin-binding protein [Sphaerothrix gracilis]|uniref:Rqc2 family fibronectin-binding protein n=1 Tax=Sphaerothrix gracilis TaxID=3151835 RepID=UPI0031FE0184
MQPVDFTTLMAVCSELRSQWLPSRCEQVYQRDRYTVCIALRTLKRRGWLTLAWHPQAARTHIDAPPPRLPDTFTFSQQLKHQLGGLALVQIEAIAPWERVLDLQFAQRPGDPVQWHLYAEIMGKYSNVILTTANQQIVTAAHQVSESQSSVRPIQTGDIYQPPPAITDPLPSLDESQADWQERISLIPGGLKKMMMQVYGGLSSALVRSLIEAADLSPSQSTETLNASDWQRLFQAWQRWLRQLQAGEFQPGWTETGYTVTGLGLIEPVETGQSLLQQYYTYELNLQLFKQLHHRMIQKLQNLLKKLRQKEATFLTRLEQSDQADQQRQQADLLMAYAYQWQPGMQSMELADFETGEPVKIKLNPEKNAIQNAQALYKQHQKLKRARRAVEPLLAEVRSEMNYLEQVEAALLHLDRYQEIEDLQALQEIYEELIAQGYLSDPAQREGSQRSPEQTEFHCYRTPSGFEVLVGRNNRQNDKLTFSTATDYDLWFHTQEIPGSHVLLRLEPGAVPDEADLQYTANLAAYFSRARQADQVPVIYTEPKNVYKPKGSKPGMVIYKREQVLWGQPQAIAQHFDSAAPAPVPVS